MLKILEDPFSSIVNYWYTKHTQEILIECPPDLHPVYQNVYTWSTLVDVDYPREVQLFVANQYCRNYGYGGYRVTFEGALQAIPDMQGFEERIARHVHDQKVKAMQKSIERKHAYQSDDAKDKEDSSKLDKQTFQNIRKEGDPFTTQNLMYEYTHNVHVIWKVTDIGKETIDAAYAPIRAIIERDAKNYSYNYLKIGSEWACERDPSVWVDTPTQQFIRNTFNPESSIPGMLLYHSTGTGKTCCAWKVVSNFGKRSEDKDDKHGYETTYYVGTPSLVSRFMEELKGKCFIKETDLDNNEKQLNEALHKYGIYKGGSNLSYTIFFLRILRDCNVKAMDKQALQESSLWKKFQVTNSEQEAVKNALGIVIDKQDPSTITRITGIGKMTKFGIDKRLLLIFDEPHTLFNSESIGSKTASFADNDIYFPITKEEYEEHEKNGVYDDHLNKIENRDETHYGLRPRNYADIFKISEKDPYYANSVYAKQTMFHYRDFLMAIVRRSYAKNKELSKSFRVLLLTATPIVDKVSDFVWLCNLISRDIFLPNEQYHWDDKIQKNVRECVSYLQGSNNYRQFARLIPHKIVMVPNQEAAHKIEHIKTIGDMDFAKICLAPGAPEEELQNGPDHQLKLDKPSANLLVSLSTINQKVSIEQELVDNLKPASKHYYYKVILDTLFKNEIVKQIATDTTAANGPKGKKVTEFWKKSYSVTKQIASTDKEWLMAKTVAYVSKLDTTTLTYLEILQKTCSHLEREAQSSANTIKIDKLRGELSDVNARHIIVTTSKDNNITQYIAKTLSEKPIGGMKFHVLNINGNETEQKIDELARKHQHIICPLPVNSGETLKYLNNKDSIRIFVIHHPNMAGIEFTKVKYTHLLDMDLDTSNIIQGVNRGVRFCLSKDLPFYKDFGGVCNLIVYVDVKSSVLLPADFLHKMFYGKVRTQSANGDIQKWLQHIQSCAMDYRYTYALNQNLTLLDGYFRGIEIDNGIHSFYRVRCKVDGDNIDMVIPMRFIVTEGLEKEWFHEAVEMRKTLLQYIKMPKSKADQLKRDLDSGALSNIKFIQPPIDIWIQELFSFAYKKHNVLITTTEEGDTVVDANLVLPNIQPKLNKFDVRTLMDGWTSNIAFSDVALFEKNSSDPSQRRLLTLQRNNPLRDEKIVFST